MFESLVASTAGRSGAGAVESWSRVENAACARRVAAMAAMFAAARAADGSASRDQWCLDNWDAVAAHVGAAQRITHGAASNQLLIAVALHERFPLVAAVFADGLITYQLVRVVVQRGALVVDPSALHELDRLLADALGDREPMSVATAEKTVDAFVAQVDPHAVHRTETRARGRGVDVSEDEDGSGMATVYATLFAHDAKAFDARVDALARTVCPADPRTVDQRRADAIGAVAHGADRLACLCETEDCPAGEYPPSTGVVVYVITHQDALGERPSPPPPGPKPEPTVPEPADDVSPGENAEPSGTSDSGASDSDERSNNVVPQPESRDDLPSEPADDVSPGENAEPSGTSDSGASDSDERSNNVVPQPESRDDLPSEPADERTALDGEPPAMFTTPLRELTLTEALTPTPGRLASLRPAALMGGQFLPGAIACRASIGASITRIVHPGQAPPEPRYRPSKKLADFVRCRDMTCRFPGCTVPATHADVDHTIPWPFGPTAASNLKCLCRRHHLLKTFWGGESGWRDVQLDDGTVVWTAPDGRQHITTPGSRLLFPELSKSTATVVASDVPRTHTGGLTMPRRKTTRAHDRARHVQRNRAAQAEARTAP